MFRRLQLFGCLTIAAASVAVAQTPSVFTGGIVSAASLAPAGSPLQAVAPGSIVSIFGSNLAPGTGSAGAVPLPTNINNVTVTIGGKAAALYFVSAGQINAQVPVDVTAGNQAVIVTRGANPSTPVNVPITATAPAIFTAGQNGRGPGAIQNYISANSQPPNSFTGAVSPGNLIIVYATGGGALKSGPATGVGCTGQFLSGTASATIGGANATLEYAGCSPGFVGLDQYNVRVPTTLPDGCFLPLQITVSGVASNMVTLSVSKGGNCNTAATGTPGGVANGTVGSAVLVRTAIPLPVPVPGFTGITASAFGAAFLKYSVAGQTSTSGAIPPAGAGCYVEVYKSATGSAIGADATATYLDAGTLTLTAPSGTYTMPRDAVAGTYSTAGTSATGGLNITTGSYTLRGTGATVGSFTSTLSIPQLFTVSNLGYAGGNFSQSSSISPTWTCPDPNGEVYAAVSSGNTTTGLYGQAYCTASCSDGKMTIPSSVLKQLPTSSSNLFLVFLTYVPSVLNAPKITASGLDFGYFLYTDATGNTGTLTP